MTELTPNPVLDAGAPLAVRSIDLDGDLGKMHLPPSSSGEPYRELLALVRLDGSPKGWANLTPQADGSVSLAPLAALVDSDQITDEPRESRPEISGQPARLSISVVLTTCADDTATASCVDQILTTAPESEIVVVENRPARSRVAAALRERFGSDERIRYCEESLPGLGRARNKGLELATGDIVVFTDDDISVDRGWLAAIRRRFESNPDIICVSGLILPLELETDTQVTIEQFANYGKGLASRVYRLAEPPADQPLFPYTAGYLASGANMAFRRSDLRGLGGFDPSLGTGTIARGGEDLDICIRVLRAGKALAYEPRALVWHRHPDRPEQLRNRVFGYGIGLGAMLGKQVMVGPERSAFLALIPRGLRYFLDPGSRKNLARGNDFPRALRHLELVGLMLGPLAYGVSFFRSHMAKWRGST